MKGQGGKHVLISELRSCNLSRVLSKNYVSKIAETLRGQTKMNPAVVPPTCCGYFLNNPAINKVLFMVLEYR